MSPDRRWPRVGSCRAVAFVAFVVGCTLALVPRDARADSPPSQWDRARDPTVARSYRLHVEVQRRLFMPRRRFDVSDSQLRAARALLEESDAERSPDPRLRFDLAIVYSRLDEHARAAKVLRAVLAEFPDHPSAEEGFLRLAFACGHNGDHACEKTAYVEVLRRATEELARATPTLNLAETEMHLGNLREAIDGYREALRLASRVPAQDTAPLAVWGLAVALDRSGDRLGAEREARFALELERSLGKVNLLREEGVFFVPAHEIFWYEGLGASARAAQAKTGAEAAVLWHAAEQAFAAYVRGAEARKEKEGSLDFWLDLAKLRVARATAEREKAEKRRAREPAPRRAPDEETTL